MISLDHMEVLLKEPVMVEEGEARKILLENAVSGGLFREAAEHGYLKVIKFFAEAKTQFTLTFMEELMCSNSFAVDEYGNTPLHLAACNGHVSIVEYFISSGETVDIRNRFEETPLYLACREGYEIIVTYLLNSGASVDIICNRECRQPIHIAAYKGHATVVQCLLQFEADPRDALSCVVEAGNENLVALFLQHPLCNRLALMSHYALHRAAQAGHVHLCDMLLDAGSAISQVGRRGMKPIELAAKHGHIDTVRLLVSRSALLGKTESPFASFNPRRRSAIDIAITEGHIAIARHLFLFGYCVNRSITLKRMIEKGRLLGMFAVLAMGADLNSVNLTTALHLACRGKLEMVKYFLQRGASINARDHLLNTPIHTACQYDSHESTLKYLILHGAEINAVNHVGETPLHLATAFSLQRILLESGADPNIPDAWGWTVLHKAKNVELVKLLLQFNLLTDARSVDGFTPLHEACQSGYSDIAELLIENGASVNTHDGFGYSLLASAVLFWSHDVVELLLESNANVNIKCKDGVTPLHQTCRHNDVSRTLRLLRRNAAVNARSLRGDTPLHCAVRANSFNNVRLLVWYGATVNTANECGETSLHIVRTAEIARFLLKNGADILVKDKKGKTPFDHAQEDGLNEITSIFIKHTLQRT